ncbi:Hypothetical predicted protein [Marmota monax]|uniref:Uncharacterized protein n=1 Tax=Marmota monax TaxID=9995 RepID=A0A5E4D289_MARMO|nr:Hypothetical predicted protein [Marmota monax]
MARGLALPRRATLCVRAVWAAAALLLSAPGTSELSFGGHSTYYLLEKRPEADRGRAILHQNKPNIKVEKGEKKAF